MCTLHVDKVLLKKYYNMRVYSRDAVCIARDVVFYRDQGSCTFIRQDLRAECA